MVSGHLETGFGEILPSGTCAVVPTAAHYPDREVPCGEPIVRGVALLRGTARFMGAGPHKAEAVVG